MSNLQAIADRVEIEALPARTSKSSGAPATAARG
jgi:hypothetical protein